MSVKNIDKQAIEIAKAINSRLSGKYDRGLKIKLTDADPDTENTDVKLDSFDGTLCLIDIIRDILSDSETEEEDYHDRHERKS